MYILAALFILKYIFIVVEPNNEEVVPYICPTCSAKTEMVEEDATETEPEEVIPFTMEEAVVIE
jgi:hypothetical protein